MLSHEPRAACDRQDAALRRRGTVIRLPPNYPRSGSGARRGVWAWGARATSTKPGRSAAADDNLWQGYARRKGLLVQGLGCLLQFLLQPGMQHGIGRRKDTFGIAWPVPGRIRTGRRRRCSPTHVLSGAASRLAFPMPVFSRLGNGLDRGHFSSYTQRQSGLFR